MSCYRFIDTQQGAYPVRCLCRVLGVAPSRYYAWQQGRQRAVGEAAPNWETALVAFFARHNSRYGTRRLRVTLHQEGHRVGRQALRSTLARRGLRALQPKAYTPRTTDSTHGLRCALNRLLNPRQFFRANRQPLLHLSAVRRLHPYFNGKLKLDLQPETTEEMQVSRDKAGAYKA